MRQAWFACDGMEFATQEECRAHDEATPEHVLAGRTAAQILAGAARLDLEIAQALETLGTEVARKRRAAGEFMRRRNGREPQETLALEGPREPEPDAPCDVEESA